MKKGVICYWLGGTGDRMEAVSEACGRLFGDASLVLHAENESDVAYAWFRHIVQGMREVSCVKAHFDPVTGKVEFIGQPMRLCG